MSEEQIQGSEDWANPAPVYREVMRVERSVVFGWTWFGIGMVRYHVSESSRYTMWMLFLTNKFAIGFHFLGVNRSA
jgi:hypothetical protein